MNIEGNIEEYAETILSQVERIVEEIKTHGLQNEQWVLDWMDRLNELSVTF